VLGTGSPPTSRAITARTIHRQGIRAHDAGRRVTDDDYPADDIASLALQLRCEHCRAAPSAWCRTKHGHGAANLHAARLLVVQAVFWLGVEHGAARAGHEVARIVGSGMRPDPEPMPICVECGDDEATAVLCQDCLERVAS
jgi:hypothetical protein